MVLPRTTGNRELLAAMAAPQKGSNLILWCDMIYAPSLTNGQQVFLVTGGIQGDALVTLACVSYPSAGAATLEYQVEGSSAWVLAKGGPSHTSTLPATAQCNWEVYGAISSIRLTFSGLVGGSGAALVVTPVTSRNYPNGIFEGFRAMTTQPYTEANIKNGSQFELSILNASVAVSATVDVIFQTGSLPVLVKDRQVATTATLAEYHSYKNPTAVAGAALPFYNLNTNTAIAQVSTVSIHLATSVSAVGTEISAPTYVVGGSGIGTATVSTFATNGASRVLVPNTTYLARFINTGSAPCAVASYLQWYEGVFDIPLS